METLKKIKALVRLNIGPRKLNSGLIPTKLPLVYCRNNTLTIENGLNLNRKNELWGIRLLSGTMVALKYGMKNSFATYNNAKELAETMIFDGKSGSLPSKDALKKHWSREEKKKFKATVSVLKKNGITAAGYSGCIWCIEKCNPLYDYCFYLELGDYGGGPKNFINTFSRIAVTFN